MNKGNHFRDATKKVANGVESSDLLACPECGSDNVEYDSHITQSRTIEWESGWMICADCDHWGDQISRNTRDDPPWTYDNMKQEAESLWANA